MTLRQAFSWHRLIVDCSFQAIVHGTDIPSFDFIGSGHSLIAAHTNGDMVIYDTRESKYKPCSWNIFWQPRYHFNEFDRTALKTYQHRGPGYSTRCISCHPVDHQYFLTSHADGSVVFSTMNRPYFIIISIRLLYVQITSILWHAKSNRKGW